MLNEINEEVLRRIELMEDPDYDPGPPLNKKDYIGIIVVGLVCIIGMIVGYYA